jgi:hypothetical protein
MVVARVEGGGLAELDLLFLVICFKLKFYLRVYELQVCLFGEFVVEVVRKLAETFFPRAPSWVKSLLKLQPLMIWVLILMAKPSSIAFTLAQNTLHHILILKLLLHDIAILIDICISITKSTSISSIQLILTHQTQSISNKSIKTSSSKILILMIITINQSIRIVALHFQPDTRFMLLRQITSSIAC